MFYEAKFIPVLAATESDATAIHAGNHSLSAWDAYAPV
jgi:hypothetical protein